MNLKNTLKRKKAILLIPASRQQKGFDLVLFNRNTKKSISIQVKGSRTYIPRPPKRDTTKRYKNYSWFNVFTIDKGLSDYYVLFGLYVKIAEDSSVNSTRIKNKNWYDFVILIFTEDEMIDFLKNLVQKKSDKQDKMFGFGFDNIKKIMLTRGAKNHEDFSSYLIQNKVNDLKKNLE